MKLIQMYTLMLMLLNNRKVTREYAAEKLGVSERTVQRYIEELQCAGVPIQAVPGRTGGYCMPDNYKLPYTFFTSDEYERISTCIAAMSHSFGDEMNFELLQKLASVSGGNPKSSVLPPIMIDGGAWNNPDALRGRLDAIGAAIELKQSVNLEYTDKDGQTSTRFFDPYCLALKEGIWYTYGWCHSRSSFRLFRLARIRSIIFSNANFSERPGTDISTALSNSIDRDTTLKIEFGASILAKVEEWLGEDAVKQDGEKYTAVALVANREELIFHLLTLGSDLTVISPESVKVKLAAMCSSIQSKYTTWAADKQTK